MTRRHVACACACALALLVLVPGIARGAGFDYPGHGTGPLARGAAFVAKADSPMALLYNPAGAARLRGTHVLLDGNILSESISFQRRNYPHLPPAGKPSLDLLPDRYRHDTSLRMPEIQNDDAPFITPFLAVTTDLGGLLQPLNLTLMAGIYGPHVHPSHTLPRYCKRGISPCVPTSADDKDAVPAPNRYDLVGSDVLVLFPTLGLAWQPIEGLSIGGHFQAVYAGFDFGVVVGALDAKEDPAYDADVSLSTTDPFTPTGIVGVHWAALPWLELGASVRFGFKLAFEGDLGVTLPESLKSAVKIAPDSPTVKVTVPMPWIVSTGVRYVNRDGQDRERFDLELDIVWESTSDVERFDVETGAELVLGSTRVSLQALTTDHYWRDTISLRFGGAYHLHDLLSDGTLTLRGGLFYVSPAAEEAYSRLDFMPFTEVGLTLGAGVRWGRYRFNVAYAYIFHDVRDVLPEGGDGRAGACAASGGAEGCGSRVVEIVPLAPMNSAVDPKVPAVGNGAYKFSVHVISIGAAVSFGE